MLQADADVDLRSPYDPSRERRSGVSEVQRLRGPGHEESRAPSVSSQSSAPSVQAFTGGVASENSWLVVDASGRDAVIIDPGAAAPQLLSALRQSGAAPRAIVLTHAHFDHVEGIRDVRAAFPDLEIWLHPADRPLYDAVPQQGVWFGLELDALPEPDRDLEPGRPLAFGTLEFEVRFTPGHAPGHVTLVLPRAGLALVGDVIFEGSVGRTDLPGGDARTLMDSIQREILTLPDSTRLLPGHGPETTVGAERATNPYVRAALAGSQP